MVSSRALSGLISGAIITVLGVYWSISPLGFFDTFCVGTPCSASLVFSGIIFIIGVAILVAGIVTTVRDRRAQTMVISMGAEAANDAAAVSSIQTSVEKGENAEETVPEQEKDEDAEYKPKEEEFAELPGDEEKPAEAAPVKKKVAKKAPVKVVPKKVAKPVKKAAAKKKK